MKDFIDDYSESTPFTQYYPYYQMMGYEQLRTYFTWRTQVRKGNVTNTSLSYAYVYLYELLNNIGVNNPQDGLEKLMSFRKSFRLYYPSIDRFVIKWFKDYHIYYNLPQSVQEFIELNNLTSYYPKMVDIEGFALYCSISRYDIRKSTFFKEQETLITDCFYFVLSRLQKVFSEVGMSFEESVIQPSKQTVVWTPFWDALFYARLKQKNRRVVISANEIYQCKNNQWTVSKVKTSESGSRLMGYIFRLIEVTFRNIMKYKYKLSINIEDTKNETVEKLVMAGYSLDKIITDAVIAFYKETTKTVVKVDEVALSIIRQEALETQEKLVVLEQEDVPTLASPGLFYETPKEQPIIHDDHSKLLDVWTELKNILTEDEIQALSVILHGLKEIKAFADECGIMLEVLIDGINEKAMDSIGDNLINEDFAIYEDYEDQVKGLIG